MKNVTDNINKFAWVIWIAILFLVWQFIPSDLLPRPLEVVESFITLWNDGLADNLRASYKMQLYALVVSLILSLLLVYLARIDFFRPVVVFISNLRFISVGPLVILFTLLISSNGETIKLWLLVFSISVFYITSMLKEVMEIPKEEFDHAKTLHMSEFRTVWEVVIYGRLDIALEIFRQNAAMGWMMITMVEGIVRNSGGIGNLLLVKQKYLNLSEIIAIIIVLFIIGFLQDRALSFLRHFLFPYSKLELKK